MSLPATQLPFCIPPEALAKRRIPKTEYDSVNAKLTALQEAMEWHHTARAIAMAMAAKHPGERGWSWKRLANQVGKYLATGDWMVFLNRAEAGPLWWEKRKVEYLPEPFLEYWEQRQGENARDKSRSEWRAIINQWKAWRAGDAKAAIPGYAEPPTPTPETGYPFGWTFTNMMRYRTEKYARKRIQIGPKASDDYRPFMLQTRVGVRPGEIYYVDDFWHDFKAIVPGAGACRLLQFHILDYASAANVSRGIKPAIKNEETKVEEGLKNRELLWLVCHHLHTNGYHQDGCIIRVEAGTSKIRDREAKILYDNSHHKIKVECGKTDNSPAFAGMFMGACKGNPRWKAALESHGNLLHNAMANMIEFPGQTGSNSRINLPEESVGMERHVKQQLLALESLPVELREKMRLDMLRLDEAIAAISRVTHAVNCRDVHELEGWRESKNFRNVWRMDPSAPWRDWSELANYDATARAAIEAYLDGNKLLKDALRMSPWEVWLRGQPAMAYLPHFICAKILDDLPGEERSVRNNVLSVKVPEINPDEPIHFYAILRDNNGLEERLADGSKWMVRVNPLTPDIAYIYGAKNTFEGVCQRNKRTCPLDVEATHEAMGKLHHAEAELMRDAARVGARIIRDRREKMRENVALLGGVAKEEAAARALLEAVDASANQHGEYEE